MAEHPDQLVVIDEAYVDFGAESAVSLVARHDNLLVVQTLSKSRALAGLRVGFAIGQRPLIEALERVKDSFNSYPLDRLAIAGAVAAIEDDAWFQETRERIIASRESLARGLSELGFEVLPSAGELRLRAPSQPQRRTSRRPASRARRSGATFPETTDRGLSPHHSRHGGSMQPVDCGGARLDLISREAVNPKNLPECWPPKNGPSIVSED